MSGRLSGIPAVDHGEAVVQLVDHGEGTPLTLDEAVERVAHLSTLSKGELLGALAYLGCQVVGRRRDANADARLAMAQIARTVSEYERRRA